MGDYSALQVCLVPFLFLSIAAHNQFSIIIISFGRMLIMNDIWSPLPLGRVKHWNIHNFILGLLPGYLLTSSHRGTYTYNLWSQLSLFLCHIRTELGGKASSLLLTLNDMSCRLSKNFWSVFAFVEWSIKAFIVLWSSLLNMVLWGASWGSQDQNPARTGGTTSSAFLLFKLYFNYFFLFFFFFKIRHKTFKLHFLNYINTDILHSPPEPGQVSSAS